MKAVLSLNLLSRCSLAILVLLVAVAVFAPVIAPYDPLAQDLTRRLTPPGSEFWFGSDALGRDIFSRLCYGARITLKIALIVALTVMPLGLLVGCVSGYCGGWMDTFLMRITDVFLAFPKLILALALVAALGPGINNAILALCLTSWPPFARLARSRAMTVRHADFVTAAWLQGGGHMYIMYRHILPLCLGPMAVRLALEMAGIIVIAAGLGFLGLGAQPPLPEWGAMIATGRKFLLDQWWVATIPGLAILIVSLGFNLLGDGLRDLLDPRNAETTTPRSGPAG